MMIKMIKCSDTKLCCPLLHGHLPTYSVAILKQYKCFHRMCIVVYFYSNVQCRYNAVNFLKNIQKRHPLARPLGRGMGCLLWIQHLIDVLSEFLQSFKQYFYILDRVIAALDCMWYSSMHLQCGQWSSKHLENASHSLPFRARYEMHFVGSNSHLYYVLLTAVMYPIPSHIRRRYNSTTMFNGTN